MCKSQNTALQAIEDELRAAKQRVSALEAAKEALSSSAIESAAPKPGDIMPDGTVYVGVSPSTGRPLYAMPHDIEGRYSFIGAQNAASAQTFGGHTDWRVPTIDELNQLYGLKGLIGRLADDWYWSSTECHNTNAWCQYFGDGDRGNYHKTSHDRVRCVRSG